MFDKGTDFPQYRKLSNDKVFYRILDDDHFDEVQIIGTKAQMRHISATQYPEKLRIQDMIHYSIDGFVPSNEQEFNSLSEKYSFL